ncbi:MAG: hypothetical protein M5T61_20405 [Acidimicrobiia bacterium]|nr:hypothetical protein [Acidimicrobiia bacterium]
MTEHESRQLALRFHDCERRWLAARDEALADQVVALKDDNWEWVRAIVRQRMGCASVRISEQRADVRS